MANTATRTPALGDDEASRKYEEAVALLANSLGERKRLFDPTYLAFAQGILAPTQTGGFGEALGNAAKSVGTAQDAEEKRNQELLQARVTVAGQNVEFQRMKQRDAALGDYLNPPQNALTGPNATPITGPNAGGLPTPAAEPAPTEGALAQAFPVSPTSPAQVPVQPKVIGAPVGALTAVESSKPPGYEGVEGIPSAPPNKDWMSGRDYIKLNRYDKSKSAGDLIKEAQEINRKRYLDKDAGVLDLASGLYYQYPTGKTETLQIHGYPGTHTIDARDAARLSFYASIDSPKYHALAKRVMEGPRKSSEAGGAPNVSSGTPNVSSGVRKSVQELATDQKVTEKFAEAKAVEEIENRKDFNQRSKDASETLATANVMRRFTEDKDFKKMTGILSDDKVSSGIAMLIRDGIGGKNFTIGIPAIEDVMRNAKLTTEQQATYRTFLMYTAQMQLNAEKAMKGSTTERERLILGNANISPQDTAETVRRKADLLTAKAQFDRQVARVFKAASKSSNMTAEDFLDSDEYLKMYDKYYEDISGIATGLKTYKGPASAAAPSGASSAPASGNLKAAQDRVREELNKK